MTRYLLPIAAILLAGGCLSFHPRPPFEPPSQSFIDVSGVRLRYRLAGEGPAVVMIHGYGGALETWDGQFGLLARDHRVLALDMKGFGLSARPEGDYSPAAQARLVFALMDELGMKEATVVAHSFGCSVALDMALIAPERITGLVLASAWVYDEQIPMFFRWSQLGGAGEALFGLFYGERPEERLALGFRHPERIPQSLVDAVTRSLDFPGTKAAALATIRSLDFERRQKRHGEIEKPVLLLWCRQDAVSRLEYGVRLERELPRARLVVFEDCGHFPMVEARAPFNRELEAFLRRVEGGPR